VIDYALKQIEESLKTPQERELDKLVENEKLKLEKGGFASQKPIQIIWA
jgi:hypothetical protein